MLHRMILYRYYHKDSLFYCIPFTSLVHNQIPFLNYILTNRKLVFNLFVQGFGYIPIKKTALFLHLSICFAYFCHTILVWKFNKGMEVYLRKFWWKGKFYWICWNLQKYLITKKIVWYLMSLFFLKNIIKDFYVFYNIFFRCPQQRINKGIVDTIRGVVVTYKGCCCNKLKGSFLFISPLFYAILFSVNFWEVYLWRK